MTNFFYFQNIFSPPPSVFNKVKVNRINKKNSILLLYPLSFFSFFLFINILHFFFASSSLHHHIKTLRKKNEKVKFVISHSFFCRDYVIIKDAIFKKSLMIFIYCVRPFQSIKIKIRQHKQVTKE